MATGSLTDYPWFFRKIIRPLGLQALQALDRLPWPASPEADSREAAQPQQPPPTGHPRGGRLQEAGLEERRLQEAGRDHNHQSYTHITVTRRGVATVRPTTPEARGGHGYRRPYGTAVSRAARHCSHAGLDVTHDRLPYGPRAAGPFSQREA